MVAFAGSDPIGVLIGAKRSSATLIHRIAVHPDHLRQGHGRHLLTSLGSKLAILGPPRIIAEVPEMLAHACDLFSKSGYVQEAVLTDYVVDVEARDAEPIADRYVIPVTVDDLVANGLLGKGDPMVCWERSVETLTARKDDIAGLAVATDEEIEAYILYIKDGDIVALRSLIADSGARLQQLLSRIPPRTFQLPKVHPSELSQDSLEKLGFRAVGAHRFFAGKAQAQ